MIILGTLWGVIAVGAMVYAIAEPHINNYDDQRRFKERN